MVQNLKIRGCGWKLGYLDFPLSLFLTLVLLRSGSRQQAITAGNNSGGGGGIRTCEGGAETGRFGLASPTYEFENENNKNR